MRRGTRVTVDVVRGRIHPRDALSAALPRVRGRAISGQGPTHICAGPRLVLSPHLDDAVLSCWRTLTAPGDVVVTTLFSGRPADGVCVGYDRIAGAANSAALMAEREREDLAALAIAGRTPTNLGYLESAYRRRAPSVAELANALGARCPQAAGILAPAAIGLHPDHVLTRRLALELWRHGMPLAFYADFPYCVTYGWPGWVTGRPSDRYLSVDAHWASALAELERHDVELQPEVLLLDADQREAKLTAMRRYRTQYPTLSRGPLDVLAHPDLLSFEVIFHLA